jgi:hypothetical protein
LSLSDYALVATGIGTAGLAVATIIQAIATRRQAQISQHQIDSTVRPWLGASDKGLEKEPGETKIRFFYINYGQMPASSVKVRGLMSEREITKDELIHQAAAQGQASLVFPGEEKSYFMRYSIDDDDGNGDNTSVQAKEKPPYVGFLIDYDYGSKHGRYGVIIKLDLIEDVNSIVDEWAE